MCGCSADLQKPAWAVQQLQAAGELDAAAHAAQLQLRQLLYGVMD
jgi:hypothetical protein